MAYSKGYGYWGWKSYLIWKTLQEYPQSIVVYADSGCCLHNNMEEWNNWFELLETYDTITFQYRHDYVYYWQKMDESLKLINAQWTKYSMIRYFDNMIGNRDWLEEEQVMGGIVLACRNSKLVNMWKDIVLMHPELIIDCYGNELKDQLECFREHRHDQSLLSALCAYWSTKGTVVKILPETAESCKDTAAVAAMRIKTQKKPTIPLKTRIIRRLKDMIGNKIYDWIHKKLSKSKYFKKWVLHMELKNPDNYF